MKIVIVLAAILATMAAMPANADPHHGVRHRSHHPHAHRGVPSQPSILIPPEHPGYRYGGPLYSTCDRINADRMLVGTCR